jgi:hypothetical protein
MPDDPSHPIRSVTLFAVTALAEPGEEDAVDAVRSRIQVNFRQSICMRSPGPQVKAMPFPMLPSPFIASLGTSDGSRSNGAAWHPGVALHCGMIGEWIEEYAPQ